MQTPTTAGSCGTGSSGIDVQEGGIDVVNPATILDFEGAGVTVTDGGGGKAIITIPGGGSLSVTDETTTVNPTTTIDFNPASGFVVTDGGGGTADVSINKAAFFSTARYTVTGSEPDLTSIVINLTSLGIAQPNTNYNSIVTGGGMAFGVSIDTVQADNATTHIHIVGGPWTAGDVLVILILPFTPV